MLGKLTKNRRQPHSRQDPQVTNRNFMRAVPPGERACQRETELEISELR